MHALDERAIRASFRNASRKEVADMTLPADFAVLDFEPLEFLGWNDPKLPSRAYVVTLLDDAPAGVLLRRAEQRLRAKAQCAWCEDVTLANDVQFFSARKAGAAGRRGDTIGTLACANLACNRSVRRLPPLAYEGYDREAARDARIRRLGERVRAFVRELDADD